MIDMEYHGPTMTVEELIRALSHLDPKLPVITEGCDCYGAAFSVALQSDAIQPYILIERDPETLR